MKVVYSKDCNNQVLTNILNDFSESKSLIILATDDNDLDIDSLNSVLTTHKSKIIGGVYPKIIYNDLLISKGLVVVSLDNDLDVSVLENISTNENISNFIEDIEINDVKTMFVLVDGLSKNIGTIVKELFDNFGLTINYLGGGAGSLSFIQKPVLFSNKGILQDGCIIATSSLASSIGVKHGWESISEPFKVTKSCGTTVLELDYKNAFDVYKGVVEQVAGKKFDDTNFFDIAKGFPFGINKISGEMVVRDPIVLDENGGLVCVGEVPEGSFVNILQGKNDTLINAAKEASVEASKSCQFENFTFFIDCISRVLFLEDEFQKELTGVYNDSSLMVGVLSLGEIANNKKYYLEFYNKTAVVAKIEQ